MRKCINSPESFVNEFLEGFERAHSKEIIYHRDPPYLYRKKFPNKVALISGGGSGHEPMHGGFVGMGMLDAACPGHVFTSPTPDQLVEAVKQLNSKKGTLFIVKNYTGDLMNFQMAVEILDAEGFQVDIVIVDDDVAVKDSLFTAGRRGTGTTVLLEKICGAAAEQGASLQEVKELALEVSIRGRSMGIALSSCTVPANGKPSFELREGEIEVGIGIHGEPGRERVKLSSADELSHTLVQSILSDASYTRNHPVWDEHSKTWKEESITSPPFKQGDKVIAFVNGLGGTPIAEQYLLFGKVAQFIQERGFIISRSLVGSYMTSLDMLGITLTLLKVENEWLKLWDAPVYTPALKWS